MPVELYTTPLYPAFSFLSFLLGHITKRQRELEGLEVGWDAGRQEKKLRRISIEDVQKKASRGTLDASWHCYFR